MSPIPPPPDPANSITVTALDIITAAMIEIGALAAGEQVSLDDSAWVKQKLQRLIDRYNARRPMVYSVIFSTFTLPVNTQPIMIGPSNTANFNMIQRPVDILTIGLLLTDSSPPVEIWVNRRDHDWWAEQRIKQLTSTLPTDFYYSPDWPLGSLYLWPIPTAVNNLIIQSRLVLPEFTNYNQSFSMPPAYWDAIVYPLAISLCPSFERTASPDLLRLSAEAIKAVESLNIQSPRGTTADAGMPGVGRRGDFNYYSGMPNQ